MLVRACMSDTHACMLRRNGRKHVRHCVQDHNVFNHVRACVCDVCGHACLPATRACMCMAVCICMHAFGHPHVRIVRVCKQSVFIGMSRKTCVCVSLDESSTLFSLGTFVDQCRETERESVCVCAGRHKAYVQIMKIHAHAHTNIH
jgi:hypothetical protein